MEPKEEQNPYQKGTLDWQTWEDEHPAGQNGGTAVRPTVGKENGTLTAQPELPTVTPTTTATETPTAPKYKGYDDIINLMTQRQQTEEQRAEEAKRAARLARTHKAVGGIADLGRALSNLYFTTQYAPNAYDPKQGMSAKAQERYDQALADYDKHSDAAVNYALNKAKYEAAGNAAEYERWKDEQAQKNWEKEFALKRKEQGEKSQARAEKNEYMRLYYDAKNKGEESRAAWYDAKSREAEAKERGDMERANYWRNKADEIANGYTKTTTTTDANGIQTNKTETKIPNAQATGSGKGNKKPTMLQGNNNSNTPSMLQ